MESSVIKKNLIIKRIVWRDETECCGAFSSDLRWNWRIRWLLSKKSQKRSTFSSETEQFCWPRWKLINRIGRRPSASSASGTLWNSTLTALLHPAKDLNCRLSGSEPLAKSVRSQLTGRRSFLDQTEDIDYLGNLRYFGLLTSIVKASTRLICSNKSFNLIFSRAAFVLLQQSKSITTRPPADCRIF